MENRKWEYAVGGSLLVVCLLAGLVLGSWLAPKPIIGMLRFQGTIDLGTADQFMTTLEKVRKDEQVAAIVLEIASPGGLATSSESLYYSLLTLRQEKPVVVVVDGIAVSGGYYMASAANLILTPSSAYIGNVGARGARPGDPTLAAEEISSGPYKLSGGSRFDHIQQLDLIKDAFVETVVHQRSQAVLNPLKADAETIAEARIYLGSEAIALGLADAEGGRSDGIRAAAEMAGLKRYDVVNLIDEEDEDEFTVVNTQAAVERMVASAPPDAVYLLDSRIPLVGLDKSGKIEQHLLHLRDIAPATLDTIPLEPAQTVGGSSPYSSAGTTSEGSATSKRAEAGP